MREYLSSPDLCPMLVPFWRSNKPVGAICHGTLRISMFRTGFSDLQACLISLLTIPHASLTPLLSRIGVLAVARCTDPVTELSLLYGRKTTTVPRYLERLGVFISSQLAGIPAKAYQLSTTWPMYEFADAGHRCSCTAPDSVCELISWAILWYRFPN